MFRTAALAIVIVGLLTPGAALAAAKSPAAPSALSISIFGAERAPDIDPTDGTPHAFMCLSTGNGPDAAATPAPECFAFRPKVDSLKLVKFASGGSITRTGTVWTEAPAGFHFAQKSLTKDHLVIFDASRDLTWTIDLPHGGSTIKSKTATANWYQVAGVGYEADPAGFVAGPEIGQHALQERLSRPLAIEPTFTRKIDPRLRTDLYSIVNAWNAKPHMLDSVDCMDLIDAVAATIGVKRPAHARTLTPSAYVRDLIKLNP